VRRSAWWTETLGLFMLRNLTCTHCVGYVCTQECVVDGDSGPLYAAARAILRLQTIFGLIPRIQAGCAYECVYTFTCQIVMLLKEDGIPCKDM
jgi:hypothetical protein